MRSKDHKRNINRKIQLGNEKKDTMKTKSEQNADIIEQDLQWLHTIIENRIKEYFDREKFPYEEPKVPDIDTEGSFYAGFIRKNDLTIDERKIILLALAAEIKPEVLDDFLLNDKNLNKSFTVFGGIHSPKCNGFLPTIKTAFFLLGGNNFCKQVNVIHMLDRTHRLFTKNILSEINIESNEPRSSIPLCLSGNTLSQIFTGKNIQMEYSSDFPASGLSTFMEWDDLVLCESTKQDLKEILAWLNHGSKLINKLNMRKNIQPGFRTLFYGPSGTGKTTAVALIGKKVGKEVYRIDLSQIVSKYIGETEKNLEKIFRVAQERDWILFFDEADALFGKRTNISNSNDRFANQETAYLLQRIEAINNLVILASNMKKNVDKAFTRRFQSVVYFPIPEQDERKRLWEGTFTQDIVLDDEINLDDISSKYNIAGGSIVNVVRYATLMALANDSVFISKKDLMDGIRREYNKEGKTV